MYLSYLHMHDKGLLCYNVVIMILNQLYKCIKLDNCVDHPRFVAQINGTACAVPRMLLSLIENNQQKVTFLPLQLVLLTN